VSRARIAVASCPGGSRREAETLLHRHAGPAHAPAPSRSAPCSAFSIRRRSSPSSKSSRDSRWWWWLGAAPPSPAPGAPAGPLPFGAERPRRPPVEQDRAVGATLHCGLRWGRGAGISTRIRQEL